MGSDMSAVQRRAVAAQERRISARVKRVVQRIGDESVNGS